MFEETAQVDQHGTRLSAAVTDIIILAEPVPHIGAALVERAVRRFQAVCRQVSVVWPEAGTDFNDMFRGAA